MRAPAAALLAVLALAACAGPITEPERAVPAPAPVPDAGGVTVTLHRSGAAARRFVEEVSARCLLDGVVGGAAMVVDRNTGRVVIVGDRDELVALDILGAAPGRTRVRLSGAAVADPDLRRALIDQIDRADRTGDTACPMLAA